MAIYPEAGNGGTAEMARRIDMTQIKVSWKSCGRGGPKKIKRFLDVLVVLFGSDTFLDQGLSWAFECKKVCIH